jgi:hypothetical protein
MTRSKSAQWGGWIGLLSLLLSLLIWSSVAVERAGQARLQVAIRPVGLPAGLRLASPLSQKLEVTVSGPKILLCRLRLLDTVCELDLAGAAAGTADFTPQADAFGLDRELKVVRVAPASLRLTVVGER